mmetsp:Transcript_78769/g.189002  ORF Transcript_78769/g.189002 Transcript_78769/m.189002 type:complete len:224 (+) Transcript_78769:770-1441(+)
MLLFDDGAPGHPCVLWTGWGRRGAEYLGGFALAIPALTGWIWIQPSAGLGRTSLRWPRPNCVSPDFPPEVGQEAGLPEGPGVGISDQQLLLLPLPGLCPVCRSGQLWPLEVRHLGPCRVRGHERDLSALLFRLCFHEPCVRRAESGNGQRLGQFQSCPEPCHLSARGHTASTDFLCIATWRIRALLHHHRLLRHILCPCMDWAAQAELDLQSTKCKATKRCKV